MSDTTQTPTLEEQLGALQGQMSQLMEQNNALQKEVESLKQVASQSPAEVKPVPKPEIPNKSFKVGKQSYVFTSAKFIIPANKKTGRTQAVTLTAADAISDPKILAELVELGSGVIKEVKE